MQDLGTLALLNGVCTSVSHSARPDSPVVPGRAPGRLRLLTASALRRCAAHLDRGHFAAVGHGHPA